MLKKFNQTYLDYNKLKEFKCQYRNNANIYENENTKELMLKFEFKYKSLSKEEFYKILENIKKINHPNICQLLGYIKQKHENDYKNFGIFEIYNLSLNDLIKEKIKNNWIFKDQEIKYIIEQILNSLIFLENNYDFIEFLYLDNIYYFYDENNNLKIKIANPYSFNNHVIKFLEYSSILKDSKIKEINNLNYEGVYKLGIIYFCLKNLIPLEKITEKIVNINPDNDLIFNLIEILKPNENINYSGYEVKILEIIKNKNSKNYNFKDFYEIINKEMKINFMNDSNFYESLINRKSKYYFSKSISNIIKSDKSIDKKLEKINENQNINFDDRSKEKITFVSNLDVDKFIKNNNIKENNDQIKHKYINKNINENQFVENNYKNVVNFINDENKFNNKRVEIINKKQNDTKNSQSKVEEIIELNNNNLDKDFKKINDKDIKKIESNNNIWIKDLLKSNFDEEVKNSKRQLFNSNNNNNNYKNGMGSNRIINKNFIQSNKNIDKKIKESKKNVDKKFIGSNRNIDKNKENKLKFNYYPFYFDGTNYHSLTNSSNIYNNIKKYQPYHFNPNYNKDLKFEKRLSYNELMKNQGNLSSNLAKDYKTIIKHLIKEVKNKKYKKNN